jgi:hypothetical protein
MMTFKRLIIAALASTVFGFGLALATPAIIDNAKATCTVGEQADGYLGFPDGATVTSELRQEVNTINIKRRAAYTDLAQKNNVSVNVAAQVTAETLIERLPKGQCYRDANGRWQKK